MATIDVPQPDVAEMAIGRRLDGEIRAMRARRDPRVPLSVLLGRDWICAIHQCHQCGIVRPHERSIEMLAAERAQRDSLAHYALFEVDASSPRELSSFSAWSNR